MAKFCAHVDVKYGENKNDMLEKVLYEGHRGFISFSEDDLAREFDKRLEIIRTRYSTQRANDEKRKNDRWYRKDDQFAELEMWCEEAVSIANEIFEEQFLS